MTRKQAADLWARMCYPTEEDTEFFLTVIIEEMLLEDYDGAVEELRRLRRTIADIPTLH